MTNLIGLKKFLDENISEESPYQIQKKFLDEHDLPAQEMFVVNDELAIREFRSLVQPPDEKDLDQRIKFMLICFYLNELGYIIEQFPDQLRLPESLEEFSYETMRSYLQSQSENFGSVTWAERRAFSQELNFVKSKNYAISGDLDEIFERISVSQKGFNSMGNREKLANMCNMIEHLLKKPNGRFITLTDEQVERYFHGFIDNQDITNFRSLTQCYRHVKDGEGGDLQMREELEEKEEFLIFYGLSILEPLVKYREEYRE